MSTDSDGYANAVTEADDADAESEPEPEPQGFGRKGWVLTAALIICVLVIPAIIYVYPYAAGSFGRTFFVTYLILPLVPAVLLGLIAVWSMSEAHPDE